ncbi:MAG TPA: small ribosomal subunit Rsm22 family protein [Candidatus Limnocylindrales bacterium]|nr:small ribosomal subunit Rsm22 family protein [Candidatus Limnocylindrales bacterium]
MDPRGFVGHPTTARAYAAARMPATYAAVARAALEGARSLPGFAPRSLLDAGAGTGAATWAAGAVWPSLDDVALVEREPAMVELGRRLVASASASISAGPPGALGGARWLSADLASADSLPVADLVVATYLLGELDESARSGVVDRLWAATRGAVLLVEPGSRAGYERILAARDRIMTAGGLVAAPCPGNVPCPIREPAWCHFLARLDRSPLQRRTKRAERSWEDEPYAYVVVVRPARAADFGLRPAPRLVLGRPRRRPGRVELRVCADGRIDTVVRSRRDGAAYRAAVDLAWGDRHEDPGDVGERDVRARPRVSG